MDPLDKGKIASHGVDSRLSSEVCVVAGGRVLLKPLPGGSIGIVGTILWSSLFSYEPVCRFISLPHERRPMKDGLHTFGMQAGLLAV